VARGNSTRRNLPPEEISELLKGNPAALQKQAQKGGNAPKPTPAPVPTAQNPSGLPPKAPYPKPSANPVNPTPTSQQPPNPTQPTPTPTPATNPTASPAKNPAANPAQPPPLPKKETPWWAQKNNGVLRNMLFGSHGRGNIEEAAIDYGAQAEMQELINKARKRMGLKPGQPLPLPQGASVPSGVSITGGK
jgi:hypothetical protein